MSFEPGTRLGVFFVSDVGGREAALLDAIEGPEPDEITLESSHTADGHVSGFTLSVQSTILPELNADYERSPERRGTLETFATSGGQLEITVGDHRLVAVTTPSPYQPGRLLIDIRDAYSSERLVTIAAMRGDEGFAWAVVLVVALVALAVVAVVVVVTRHHENMAAIEHCVPLENTTSLSAAGSAAGYGSGHLSYSGQTRVHKTEER
jgi:hypothetical protein